MTSTATSAALAAVYADVTERHLQQRLATTCRLLRVGHYHTFWSKFSEPGFPDSVVALPPDRYPPPWLLFVEIKTERGRLSPAQRVWRTRLELIADADPGVAYVLLRPSTWPDLERRLVAPDAAGVDAAADQEEVG